MSDHIDQILQAAHRLAEADAALYADQHLSEQQIADLAQQYAGYRYMRSEVYDTAENDALRDCYAMMFKLACC